MFIQQRRKLVVKLVACSVFFVSIGNVLLAATVYVGATRTYTTIQSGVDAAGVNGIVIIDPGTYHEEVVIATEGITLKAADPLNPPELDGSDQNFPNGTWTAIGDGNYKITNYAWDNNVYSNGHFINDVEYMSYSGGKSSVKSFLRVYEDGVLLRGYRNKYDPSYWGTGQTYDPAVYTTGYGGPYSDYARLWVSSDDDHGLWPDDKTKQSLQVDGRFCYMNWDSGSIYVRAADLGNANNKTYNIPVLLHLIQVKAPGVIIQDIVFKYSLGFALVFDDAEDSIVEDCYFINNHHSIWAKEAYSNLVIRRNFIQQKGFWERYWYKDTKGTLQWGFAVELDDDYSTDCQIYDNTISNNYGGIRARGMYHDIHDNLISKMLSAGIYPQSLPTDYSTGDYTAKIYRNIIHHVDYSGGAIPLCHYERGPVYIYRNLIYRCWSFGKDGTLDGVTETGYKYIYNNTGVLLKMIVEHPYYRPSYKKAVLKNNLFHVRSNGWESFFQYWKSNEPDWDYTTFANGPLLSHNMYWKASTDLTKVWVFKSNSEDMRYDMSDFAAMQASTGQDIGSIVADPKLINSDVFDIADVFTLQYDDFSEQNYSTIINDGYFGTFKESFIALYNYFVISPDNTGINGGEVLPSGWPDIKPWDAKPDIGMGELDKASAYLLGHWAFENASGSAVDSSLYNRNGVLKGSTAYTQSNPLAGNSSATFDGATNSYIEIEDSEDLIFGTGNFSISAWIKIDLEDVTQHRGIVSKGQGYQNGDFAFYIANDGKKLRFLTTQDGTQYKADGSVTVADGNIHHVVVIRRWSALYFYVDGVMDSASNSYADFFSGHTYDTNNVITIGARGLGAYRFDGMIDDVRIYNTGLWWSDIQILKNK